MLEDILTRQNIARALRSGPAASHLDGYVVWLIAKGYRSSTIALYLHALARYMVWAVAHDRAVDAAALALLDDYLDHLGKRGKLRREDGKLRGDPSAARLFTRFLTDAGVAEPPPPKATLTERFPILAEFETWGDRHRGLRASTMRVYLLILGRLLESLGDDPATFTAAKLRDFVLAEGSRFGVERAATITIATRAFVRFLIATGRAAPGMDKAIPHGASWSLSSLPRYLEPADLERVIEACPTDTAIGIRDRAIVLLLSRLGLRAGDVAGLRVKDIDWTNGRFAVVGKGRRLDWLPLPQDVGDAILHYLREARPRVRNEAVFLTVLAPHKKLTFETVSCACRRAVERSGVNAPTKGAHLLRHSAATAMLRGGASLTSVGAVLRHRSPQTTAHYAKVDLDMLAKVAQPWPEVSPC